MSIGTGIYSLLRGNAGVAAIFGGRIFPVLLPEKPTLPAMTYQIIGGSSEPTLETSGMQRLRVQFDVFDDQYKEADTGRDAIRKLLNGFVGTLADGTILQNADLIQSTDYYEQDPRLFRCMSEFYLYFTFSS